MATELQAVQANLAWYRSERFWPMGVATCVGCFALGCWLDNDSVMAYSVVMPMWLWFVRREALRNGAVIDELVEENKKLAEHVLLLDGRS